MEIKSCGEQLLIFLWTLGAKSISSHHMQRVNVIMEEMMHKSSCRVSPAHYTLKLGFLGSTRVHVIPECTVYTKEYSIKYGYVSLIEWCGSIKNAEVMYFCSTNALLT